MLDLITWAIKNARSHRRLLLTLACLLVMVCFGLPAMGQGNWVCDGNSCRWVPAVVEYAPPQARTIPIEIVESRQPVRYQTISQEVVLNEVVESPVTYTYVSYGSDGGSYSTASYGSSGSYSSASYGSNGGSYSTNSYGSSGSGYSSSYGSVAYTRQPVRRVVGETVGLVQRIRDRKPLRTALSNVVLGRQYADRRRCR